MNKLHELMGAGASVVSRTFDMMNVAEEQLKAHGLTNRKGAFMVLMPPKGMSLKSTRVYRAHAKELCERMLAGADTRTGTKAEMLSGIMDHATKTPLSMAYTAAATLLFNDVMGFLPADFAPLGKNERSNAEEIIRELERTVVDEDRRLP